MKQTQKFYIGLSFFILLFSNSMAQKLDFEPLDAYWKMIEPLKRNDSLSLDDWNTFLSLEPNKVYIENQAFDSSYLERLRKTIQIVYMPRYDSLLAVRVAAIDIDPSSFWLTYKVYMYKKYEQDLKEYQHNISGSTYLTAIYDNAFKWLPKRLQNIDTTVTFHFLGIENDAIAGGGTIIATLWQIYIQDKLKLGLLGGHEMHHVLRKGITFKNIPDNEKGIMYLLSGILNEGTADMIDKTYNIAHDDELPMGTRFKEFELYQADSIVKQIDTSLSIMAKSNGAIYKTEKDYRNLIRWTSGHCPGYYMTEIIVRNGYKKQLLKNIQNPFAFIYLYNRAALKDAKNPPYFSNVSIDYVKHLEQKYFFK